jgi:uncharacterized membrane protein
MRTATTVLAAVALVAGVWGILHVGWYGRGQIVDYGVYQHYGDSMRAGAVPYRDFKLEYPPGALPVFVIPSWLERFNYQYMFQLLMAICLVVVVLSVLRIAGWEAALLAGLAPLALGSVTLSRFDLWPAALTAAALAMLVSERFAAAAVLLGTAFAAKLWPAVLVPFVIVWLVRNHGPRLAARWSTGLVAVAAAWFLPFTVLSPAGVGHAFHEQLGRPVQLESLAGAVLIAIHDLFGTPIHRIDSFGSQNLDGWGTHAAATITTVAGALALVAVWLLFVRGFATTTDLLTSCAAVVATLLAFGKVFSPQFLIWLIPLVVIARGARGQVAIPIFFATLVLTQLWFPHHYWDLANGFARPQTLELLARDFGVLLLAVVLAWPRRSEDELLGEHRSRLEALQRVRTQVD